MRIDLTVEGVDALDARLGGISERLVGLTPAWEQVADDFLTLEDAVWRTDGAAIGESWAPLSPAWAAFKANRYPGAGILEEDGRLRRSMSRRGATYQRRQVGPSALVVGTSLGVASIHQKGATVTLTKPYRRTVRIPARPFVKARPADERRWAGIIDDFVGAGGNARRRSGL